VRTIAEIAASTIAARQAAKNTFTATFPPYGANFLDGAGAIAHDASAKIHRYYGGYSADNGSSAFQCFIRNVKGERFYVGLAVAVVAVDRMLKEIGHGYASY
jgi:hypothetical protein